MGRLYWKIFLGFWLTTVIIVVVTSWSVSLLLDQEDPEAPTQSRQHWHLTRNTVTAELLLQSGGEPALREWLRFQERGKYRPWVVDTAGQELLGRPLPPALQAALKEGSGHNRVREIKGPGGRVYRLWIPSFTKPSLWPPKPELFALRLGLAILLSGLICWGLARYLTQPIRHLQAATHRLAAGDLSTRVATAIAGRRDEIADLGRDFDRMATRLEHLLATQRQLLRDVSHELRSPLTRLQVALGLARRRTQGAAAELDRIELEARRLEELIGQLLSLMRLESGADIPVTEPVNLSELLQGVARDAVFEAESCQRRVEVTETVADVVMAGNKALLRSALENLVRNGIRHTAAGTAVDLSLTPDPERANTALIRVRDHGPGVPEPDLPRLFDPFFRVQAARDRGSGGYGLGLTIAAQAVRFHGGDIVARNADSGGLVVLVRLPLGSVKAEDGFGKGLRLQDH